MATAGETPKDPDNWDPTEAQRRYYRSTQTGDLGYVVMREGKERIRLHRGSQEIIKVFDEGEWAEERDFRPFSKHQVDRVCFEADKALCGMLNLHKESKRDWLNLRDAERIEWGKIGPGPGSLRSDLYVAIQSVLRKHSR